MNPAYDITYHLGCLEPGTVHRVGSVRQRVGGKGLNVTRILIGLGKDCLATGLASTEFADEAERELPADFVLGLPWVRRTIAIQETEGRQATTGLWEPGAIPAGTAADKLVTRVAGLLYRARGLVVSGSLPPQVDSRLPADLARLAVAAGIPAICDVSGPALRHAARVPGVVLMPNTDELAELTGRAPTTPREVTAAARALLDAGVGAVVATRGPEGVIAVTEQGAWSARLTTPIIGNATGAGDAAAAAVIARLAEPSGPAAIVGPAVPSDPAAKVGPAEGSAPTGSDRRLSSLRLPDMPGLLADVVATSAAAVATPVAGEIDLELRLRLLPTVVVERVDEADREERT
ncbi:PfkB family carbohydrate kinase [Nocardia sp. NPDC050406]|uniref:PfkB family carbohydrate kinase n=1 Tax=Nocardia sp. NPDC050406 TaxID=3364318 RepID=UPI0037ABA11B